MLPNVYSIIGRLVKLPRQEPGAPQVTSVTLLEPSGLTLHLQAGVWSFVPLDKKAQTHRIFGTPEHDNISQSVRVTSDDALN